MSVTRYFSAKSDPRAENKTTSEIINDAKARVALVHNARALVGSERPCGGGMTQSWR